MSRYRSSPANVPVQIEARKCPGTDRGPQRSGKKNPATGGRGGVKVNKGRKQPLLTLRWSLCPVPPWPAHIFPLVLRLAQHPAEHRPAREPEPLRQFAV